MAPKKVSIKEPRKEPEELGPFSPPLESPEEIKERIAAERAAEQEELDNAWKKIPYVDQKHLRAGNYCGFQMESLFKSWQHGPSFHPHDFYKSSRQSRGDDLAKHYEFGELLKRHDRLVFELEAWRKREFLKDDMRVQSFKMYMIQKERERFQKLRKEIRAEQLHYESTLRWPLSPHAVRSGFDSDEENEEDFQQVGEVAAEGDIPEGELPEGMPPSPEGSGPEASSSEGAEPEAAPPRRKKKAAPRMRYSLFHFDVPRRLKRAPVVVHTPDEKPFEYSPIVHAHTPAWIKGKAAYIGDLAQQVQDLCAWEEKLPGGGGGGGGGKKGSIK